MPVAGTPQRCRPAIGSLGPIRQANGPFLDRVRGQMFGRMLGLLSADMAVDLGTANTVVYVKGRGRSFLPPIMRAPAREADGLIISGIRAAT